MNEKNESIQTGGGLSRRAFIGSVGAAAAVAAAGLAGCSPKAEINSTPGAGGEAQAGSILGKPAFFTPPPVPTAVANELDCDVLVIGVGLAGVAAAREAAENGAKVIAVEKQAALAGVSMAGDFGVVGSQIQKDLGIEWASKEAIVNQLQKDMTYRTNPQMLNYWYDHSGVDFDWFIEGADFEVLPSSAANKKTDNPFYIRPKCFPPLPGYDWRTEYYPYFHGTITTNPNMDWAMANCLAKGEENGVEVLFGTVGEQLIKDASGAVAGAYVHDFEGNYTKINCKAVVLSTGDFGNNKEMRDYYLPWCKDFLCIYTQLDANGVPCDTGDGQLMGIWVGGDMEYGPHGPMTHHMGGALGVNAYLNLNLEGKRFMNEDIPGQNIADQLNRQPGHASWQIFDANWPETLASQPTGHGYFNYFITEEEIPEYETVLDGMFLGYTTAQMVEDGVTFKADTLEELATLMELPVDVVTAEVARYNELCAKGEDTDFGKDSRRLYPVLQAPFYACKFDEAMMLVVMGGLNVDLDLHVLDANNAPIPGLYAAGNNQGGRFLVEYPVTVAGISLATALSFGRLAGRNAAKAL